ncbi:MAG: carbonic anhydrase [Myxococcota bacterium]
MSRLRSLTAGAALVVASTALAGSKSHDTSHSGGSKGDVHWSYDGETGPAHWSELSPDFAACAQGRQQTPVDVNLRYADTVGLEDLVLHYHPSHSSLLNNGHTVQASLEKGNAVELDGKYYELLQLHFHSPSEHRLNGKLYPMEMHLVHKDAEGHLAVVGVLIEEGEATPAFDPVFAEMAIKAGQEKELKGELDPAALLPARHELVRYSGSLTTPPCSEGVRWTLYTEPVTLSAKQIEQFKKLYDHNARPIQALNGRPLLVDATP